MVESYVKWGFIDELIEKIFCKKAEFIMGATTKTAMKEILQPSISHYTCGEFYPKGDLKHYSKSTLISE